MEITDIETILLSCEIPENRQWHLSGIREEGIQGRKSDMVIVRVRTDAGITGIGEPSPYGGATSLAETIKELEPAFVGEDPHDVERLTTPTEVETGWTRRCALAALNMACWDIVGKAAGQPVSKLLGGRYAEEIPVYASGGIDWEYVNDPDILIEEAERYLEAGFTAFKFRVGPDERFLDAIERLHDAVGAEMDLILEGNSRFTPGEAVRMAERCRQFEFEPRWFEEPLSDAGVHDYRRLRAALPDLTITGGESTTSFDQVKPWVDEGGYGIVQPDANVLGISETKRVADFARYVGIDCVPHSWHNAITMAANLHVVAAIPNRDVLEFQRTWHWSAEPFRRDILTEPIEISEGVATVPDGPGLGISLDDSVLDDYPFEDGPVQVAWDGPAGEHRPL